VMLDGEESIWDVRGWDEMAVEGGQAAYLASV
jgi:hypothetical protein